MSQTNHPLSDKIVNAHLAHTALHNAETFGEFQAIVRLAEPGKYPAHMTVTGVHSPGRVEGLIPCREIEELANDRNVLCVELRAHVM